ncbi:hypothetical protein A7A76_06030 [Lysobacter enzymogenes]|uniref:XVIPCD domain-containing protein n=1 Tax=Lysobacter enzymogenes TaxID=69 RepID=UPI0019CFD30D|nr:XVIPCD domain-containing protein [Lysobacter enzymogenes]MBN7138667.1 hypothetical protein [Lysobacter enzymogenes]
MPERVKVGLDEWVAADARRVELMTDGLSGCVAVGLAGNGKVSLAHVYSECDSDKKWADYLPKLESSLEASGLGDLRGSRAILVCAQGQGTGKFANASSSDDPAVKASQFYLPDKLKTWLESKGMTVETRQDAGCTISADAHGVTCSLKAQGGPDAYRYHYSTTADEVPGVSTQVLSHKGAAAGESHTPPGNRRLSDREHPANALYERIIDAIPREAVYLKSGQSARESTSAQLAAGALTLECLRHGVVDIDGVVAGENPEGDAMLFAYKGTQPESMRHFGVNMDDGRVSERSLDKYGELAAKLHETQVAAVEPATQVQARIASAQTM